MQSYTLGELTVPTVEMAGQIGTGADWQHLCATLSQGTGTEIGEIEALLNTLCPWQILAGLAHQRSSANIPLALEIWQALRLVPTTMSDMWRQGFAATVGEIPTLLDKPHRQQNPLLYFHSRIAHRADYTVLASRLHRGLVRKMHQIAHLSIPRQRKVLDSFVSAAIATLQPVPPDRLSGVDFDDEQAVLMMVDEVTDGRIRQD